MVLSKEELLDLGLQRAGFSDSCRKWSKTSVRRFRAFYGAAPETCIAILADLSTTAVGAALFQKKQPDPMRFLMALHWMKSYEGENVLAGRFGKDEKTIRKSNWMFVAAIQALKDKKVSPAGEVL